MLPQPSENDVVPFDRVGRLLHPMALVRKVEEATLDAAALQRRECAEALRQGHAVVAATVDHEHRRAPRPHVIDGIETLVVLRDCVVRPAEFPLRKPELFRRVIHAALVEYAVVVDEAAEARGPAPRDPVDHEAAERGTERAGALAVEPGITRDSRREAFLQIDERLAAPVAAHRIRERLAIARRAVEIDEHDTVPGTREHLRIPAVAPLVRHARLRTAVDDEGDRIAPGRIESMRPDDVPIDFLSVPSGEA